MANETSKQRLENEKSIEASKERQLDIAKKLDFYANKSHQTENDILARIEEHRDVTFSLIGNAKKHNSMSMDALKIIKSKIKEDGSLAEVYKDQLSKVKQINNKNVSMLSLGRMFLDSRKKTNEAEKKGHVNIASQQKNLGKMAVTRGKMLIQEKAGNFLQKSNVTIMGAILGVFNFLVKSAMQFDSGLNSIGKRFGSLPELGDEFNTGLINAGAEVISIGASLDDVISVTGELTSEFGLSLDEAKDISAQVVDTAKATGLATQQAAKLTGIFIKISGLTADQAEHLIESTRQLATQNRVAPVAVLEDLAAAAEQVALFTQGSGENITEAAVQARALGTNFGNVASTAEALLDVVTAQRNINDANVIAGTQLNVQRAQQLAAAGDLKGLAIEQNRLAKEFFLTGKQDFLSRKAVAKALGMTTVELMKQKNLSKEIEQIDPFEDLLGEESQGAISRIINELKALAAIALNTFGPAIETMARNIKDMIKTDDFKDVFKTLQSAMTEAFKPENLQIFMDMVKGLNDIIQAVVGEFNKMNDEYEASGKSIGEGLGEKIKQANNTMETIKDVGRIGSYAAIGAAAGTFFGPGIGTAIGALGGAGLGALQNIFMDDGVVSPGGIKYMTGPAGTFELNPRDSVLATTNPIKVNEFAQGNVSVGGDGAVVKAIDNLTTAVMSGIPLSANVTGHQLNLTTDKGNFGGAPGYESLVSGKR